MHEQGDVGNNYEAIELEQSSLEYPPMVCARVHLQTFSEYESVKVFSVYSGCAHLVESFRKRQNAD